MAIFLPFLQFRLCYNTYKRLLFSSKSIAQEISSTIKGVPMGLRFQRSIKILPGVRINVGKKGSSISIGGRGAHIMVNKKGVRSTVGIPGTGLSYTDYKPFDQSKSNRSSSSTSNALDQGANNGLYAFRLADGRIVEIPFTPTCPYCGHHMRKVWPACPTCHADFIQYYANLYASESSTASMTANHPSHYTSSNGLSQGYSLDDPKTQPDLAQAEKNTTAGCVLLLIIVVAIICIFAVM